LKLEQIQAASLKWRKMVKNRGRAYNLVVVTKLS
jgi:hypothetical protein